MKPRTHKNFLEWYKGANDYAKLMINNDLYLKVMGKFNIPLTKSR